MLGAEAYALVQALGEPNEVQTLPAGGGRILLYDGAAVQLGLDEATGAEVVLGVTATGGGLTGPRGLAVGMTAAGCRGVSAATRTCMRPAGAVYMEGEAYGEPPFAEMTAVQRTRGGHSLPLPNGWAARPRGWMWAFRTDTSNYWHLYTGGEAADGE